MPATLSLGSSRFRSLRPLRARLDLITVTSLLAFLFAYTKGVQIISKRRSELTLSDLSY
jgi:hypothetical protein